MMRIVSTIAGLAVCLSCTRPEAVLPAAPPPVEIPLIGNEGTDKWGGSLKEPDMLAIRRLFQQRRFAELDEILDAVATAAEADPYGKEHWTVLAFGTLEQIDSDNRDLVDAWVAHSPEFFAPYLVRGHVWIGVAFRARGKAWARDTTEEQFAGFREGLRLARADFEKSLSLRQTVSGHRGLIRLANYEGGRAALDVAVAAALARFPASYGIHSDMMSALRPRWGGSYEEMAEFARRADVKRNRKLEVLPGFIALDQCNLAQDNRPGWWDRALPLCRKAAEGTNYYEFLLDQAEILIDVGRNDEAKPLVAEMMRVRPQRPIHRILDAVLMARSGKREEGAKALLAVTEVLPGRQDDYYRFGRFSHELADGLLSSVMPAKNKKSVEEKKAALDLALSLAPDSGRVHSYLSRFLHAKGELRRAESEAWVAARYEPYDWQTWYAISTSYGGDSPRWGEALEIIKSLRTHQRGEDLDYMRAKILIAAGREEEAREVVRRSCERGTPASCSPAATMAPAPEK